MSEDNGYGLLVDHYKLQQKDRVHEYRVDRSKVRDYFVEHGTDWAQLDDDMIIEFNEELKEEGFDMSRTEDIEVVKEFAMTNELIFLQKAK